jgi:hypothetical protein
MFNGRSPRAKPLPAGDTDQPLGNRMGFGRTGWQKTGCMDASMMIKGMECRINRFENDILSFFIVTSLGMRIYPINTSPLFPRRKFRSRFI